MNPNVIGPLLFALVGLGGIVVCVVSISRAIDSEQWMHVNGEILDSRVEYRGGKTPTYEPVINYKYTVEGVTYEGSRVRFGGTSGSKSAATEISNKFHGGRIVTVSVDPNDHSKSVLQPGLFYKIFFPLVIFMILFGIGLSLVVTKWRS